MTYVRDRWEASPGSVTCRHGITVAMDNEGVVRHKGSGSLCHVVPVPRSVDWTIVHIDGTKCPEGCALDVPHYARVVTA